MPRATTISAASREGHLVLLGGGPTPAVVFTRTLNLSGGRSAIVAVLPQTYPNDSIGDAAVELWKKTGAREVFKLKLDDMDRARADLERATLIWMPGGFQGLLMKTLAGTPIPDVIRRRFAEGATIGGASAGAAAMSATMIADESTPEGENAGGPRTMEGLGLWPAAIVSPHFTERRRSGPLVAIVRDHPDSSAWASTKGRRSSSRTVASKLPVAERSRSSRLPMPRSGHSSPAGASRCPTTASRAVSNSAERIF